ncbi:hypothetical protein CYMTET_29448 [Cymbomonas tetramitiformis]|uniref:Sugar phosphate transporter domain-containing protein n=1 Tax=Cymbomonas tetramitiformis TaxID=36881 RepID=A0AAE0FKZ0_9CHLO|nr:hypothetical protein CYMTET_29448 [Cymbomonas tetramitiformis]
MALMPVPWHKFLHHAALAAFPHSNLLTALQYATSTVTACITLRCMNISRKVDLRVLVRFLPVAFVYFCSISSNTKLLQIITITISMTIWDHRVSTGSTLCLLLSMFGGVCYQYSLNAFTLPSLTLKHMAKQPKSA